VNDDRCYNCGRANPSLWGFSPLIRSLGQDLGFIYVIMGGTIILYVLTLVWSAGAVGGGLTTFLAPTDEANFIFGASGAGPAFVAGRWWTVLSAGWLHGGLLHIAFNLLWVRQLAPETAELYGPGRTVIIYTFATIIGFAVSSTMGFVVPSLGSLGVLLYTLRLGGAELSVGASAAILGLLGAHVCYSHRTGSRYAGAVAWQYAVVLILFGFVMHGVDNWAHIGGFAGGYLTARVLNPSKAERLDHLIGAVVCLAATLAAVVASVVTVLLPR